MAHKLEGIWHSHVVVKLPNGKTAMAEDDLIVIEKVNETTGKIEDGTHLGKQIKGSIIPAGSSFAVSMEHDLSLTFNSRYEGAFVSEDPVHNVLVIVGTKRRVPRPTPLKGEDQERRAWEGEVEAAEGSQEDGTWVATKP